MREPRSPRQETIEGLDRLSQREDATWLAEVLIEIETDPDDITRLRLIDGLLAART
jgi:hypothetical protein